MTGEMLNGNKESPRIGMAEEERTRATGRERELGLSGSGGVHGM
jgi:hypothetical protein